MQANFDVTDPDKPVLVIVADTPSEKLALNYWWEKSLVDVDNNHQTHMIDPTRILTSPYLRKEDLPE